VHEPEEGQHGAGQRERRSLGEFAVDDERANGTEHQAGQDRAAAHHLEALIQYALANELVEPDRGRAGTGGAKGAVHQRLAPRRKMRSEGKDDRGAWDVGVVWNAWAPMSMPM
jgi:hypothetical protein